MTNDLWSVIVALVLILIVIAVAVVAAQLALTGRRDVAIYGSILDFNRKLSNIALLRSAPPALRISTAALWDEPSVIGTPPPTVRLIGPDGRPVEPAPQGAGTSARRSTRDQRGKRIGAYGGSSPGAKGVTGSGSEFEPGTVEGPAPTLSLEAGLPLPPGSGHSHFSHSTLRRRKAVFQTLLGAFAVTFVVGLLPGFKVVLLLSLVCGVLLAAYVFMLRKIKLQSSLLSDGARHRPMA